MKIIYFLFLCLVFNNASAQNFGSDRIASTDSTHDVSTSFISTAFNGWIYVAYNYNVVGSGFTGRVIEVSKDNGITWQVLVDLQFNPQNVIAFTSMIVAGTDTSNLRIFTTGTNHFNQYQSGFISVFDGLTGTFITPFISLADGNNFGIGDMAICSDWKYPYLNPAPYSIAVAYSQYDSSTDSVLLLFSNDGGINFTGPYFVATGQDITNVEIAYGSYHSPAVGRYSVIWEQNGNIGGAQSDVGNPMIYSYSSLLDTIYPNLSGLLHNPVISIQSAIDGNGNNDYSTAILAERFDSTTSTNDIVGFFNNDTQNGGFGYPAIVDSSSDNTIKPSISFDEVNGNFIATWYNETTKELPCFNHDMNFPGIWIPLSLNYADTSMFDSPRPVISTNGPINDVAVCWIQETDTSDLQNSHGVLKYDATALPLIISSQQVSEIIKVNPNVTDNSFTVFIAKEYLQTSARLEIFNSSGHKVYLEKISKANNDFVKNYNLGLSTGTYFINFNNGERLFTQKIIIQ